MNKKTITILATLCIVSLTLSSCFQWGPRAFKNFPKETALDKTYNYNGKVIIIGAGAAGLAAAKILERNKVDYQVLEATDRYGGRLKKNETLADFPIDIGAEWIHNQAAILNRLKGKKGDITDEELIPYHLESGLRWDGKKLEKISKKEIDQRFEFFPEYKFKRSTWYDYVNENFAQEVKHKIKFNSPVTEVNYANDKVEVKTRNGEVFMADKVLVTVSVGVLKSNNIKFIPDLSPEKKEAINAVGFLPGLKLFLKFSQKFYPDVVDLTHTDGEVVYYDIAFKKEAQSNILGALFLGKSAEEYYRLDAEEKIVSAVLKELDQIFNGKASEFYSGEYVLENWGQHEFTKGTWVNAALDKNINLKVLNQPLQKKVYFAGEVNDVHQQMGVPGALLSGYVVIDRLLTNEK